MIDWIRVEDQIPEGNGKVQEFMICRNRRSATKGNCLITTGFFTNRFYDDDGSITHWAHINKPKEYEV